MSKLSPKFFAAVENFFAGAVSHSHFGVIAVLGSYIQEASQDSNVAAAGTAVIIGAGLSHWVQWEKENIDNKAASSRFGTSFGFWGTLSVGCGVLIKSGALDIDTSHINSKQIMGTEQSSQIQMMKTSPAAAARTWLEETAGLRIIAPNMG